MATNSHVEKRSASPAVTMAATVLDVLAAANPDPLGPSEIGRRLGIAKSSVANVCTALALAGFVRRRDDGYVLGQRLAELGATYLDGVDEIKVFHDVCAEYVPALKETVQIAVLGPDLDVAHIASRDGTIRIRVVSDAGRHLPATCTATGKALLAALPDYELDRRLEGVSLPTLTSRSIANTGQLRRNLDETRARGWAIDDEEMTDGILCLGAVVPKLRATPTYALGVTLLRAWVTPEHCDELGDKLLGLTATMANRLGHGSLSA
jgi:DNA-binding IclR family transcriptional regulator